MQDDGEQMTKAERALLIAIGKQVLWLTKAHQRDIEAAIAAVEKENQ